MNVDYSDYFRYLVLACNFLNFRLCEIQLGAQCRLGEHGPLKLPDFKQPMELLSTQQVKTIDFQVYYI